jgi:ribonuclease G
MEIISDREKLLEFLRAALKKDRVRTDVSGMTPLGLVEITRKKTGREISFVLEKECSCCQGKGRIPRE